MQLADDSAFEWLGAPSIMGTEPTTALQAQGRRILVADDHRETRERLTEFLEVQGHSVRTASDGIEALIEAGKFLPEIAFLDLLIPRMDGFELCARLRANTSTQDSALFALTADGTDTHIDGRASARFDAYLRKPIELNIVEALVNATTADVQASYP